MEIHLILSKLAKAKFFVGMLIFGIVFGGVGFFILSQPQSEKIEVTATVVNVHEEYDYATESYTNYADLSYVDNNGVSHISTDFPVKSGVEVNDEIQVCYDVDNPELLSSTGGEFLPYILIVLGVILFLAGVVIIIKVLSTPLSTENHMNKVNMENVSESRINAVRESDEEKKEYYFHFTGKLNQSYIMETPSRQPIYEAVSQKLALFTKFQFNFVNHLTHREEMKEVTHTLSTSYGSGNIQIMTESKFKINGTDCWKLLGDMGYSLVPHMTGLHASYEVQKYGIVVATMEQAGANVATGKEYKFNIPTAGVYTISCRESDIEGVFLACFILSRTFK